MHGFAPLTPLVPLGEQQPLLALRGLQCHRFQLHLGAWQALRQACDRKWCQRSQSRVAANRLPVVEQYDGLAIWRDLDGDQRYAF